MPFVQARDSVTVNIPAGQSIRVGNFRGSSAQMSTVQPNRPNGPVIPVATGNNLYGPYPQATDVVLTTLGYDPIEYIVGASPVLTNVPFNPATVAITGGIINGTSVGATTRSTVAATQVSVTATDSTATPGNVTNNSANGRAAFAAAGTSVVVTNSQVAAGDTVHVTLLSVADATLTAIVGVTVAAGSFTVTGNAAATATKGFMFTVVKA